MRPVISQLLLPHQGGMTTATLVALVSVNLVNLGTTANHENHAIGNYESSENLRLPGSSESPIHPESTVNLQQIESIASHLHPENHLHPEW